MEVARRLGIGHVNPVVLHTSQHIQSCHRDVDNTITQGQIGA
jgi:hypothetical protein